MAGYKFARAKKIRYRIGHFFLWPFIILLVAQPFLQPYFDNWRCERIARELEQQYGLVVRYKNPSEFYVRPLSVIHYDENNLEMGRARIHSALLALKGARQALALYPASLIKQFLSAVFVSGLMKNSGIQGAGTYAYSWIFISATPEFDKLGQHYYAETLHHELSSLFLKSSDFPKEEWLNLNSSEFKYLEKHSDVIQASSIESRRDPKEAKSWYKAGFVHDYGMASIENDVNTYAELAMGNPLKLKELCEQYQRIMAKTAILVQFYTKLSPKMAKYFESVGLLEKDKNQYEIRSNAESKIKTSDSWRCEQIASELEQQFGLVVRFGEPSEFFVPPLKAQTNSPDIGFSIGRANEHSALTALKGIHMALRKYPKDLLRKYLTAIFVSGKITIHGVEGGGTYLHSWIYLAALEEFESIGAVLYEQNLHHELSSLFLKSNKFPTIRWHLANTPGFKYLPRKIDVIHAASEKQRRDPKEAPLWFNKGFVSDYGMSSLENDYNVFAALAMTHPEELKKLADQYPRIQAKTRILADFYSSLAPELAEYMASAGLTKTPGSTQAHQERQQ